MPSSPTLSTFSLFLSLSHSLSLSLVRINTRLYATSWYNVTSDIVEIMVAIMVVMVVVVVVMVVVVVVMGVEGLIMGE